MDARAAKQEAEAAEKEQDEEVDEEDDYEDEAKGMKGTVEALISVAADELKKNGSFKIAGALNLKLKKKPATPARKGVNPFTKEPCVFKAKPASKTVRALPMKKLKELIN